VAYWARGGIAHAVTMIHALSVKLGITERVRAALPQTTVTREANHGGLGDPRGTRLCAL